jgi:catalase-peroxidase
VRDFVAAWNKVMNLDRFDLLAKARVRRERAAAATA